MVIYRECLLRENCFIWVLVWRLVYYEMDLRSEWVSGIYRLRSWVSRSLWRCSYLSLSLRVYFLFLVRTIILLVNLGGALTF